jgi:predicted DNA binding protein
MESINLLRLKSGEDIICYIENYGHDEIVIRDAMVVFIKTDMKTGNQIAMLDHWLPVSVIKENEAIVKMSEVLAIMNPSAEFTEYFEISVEGLKQSKEHFSNQELSSSDDDELTPEDMRLILDAVGPTNVMH